MSVKSWKIRLLTCKMNSEILLYLKFFNGLISRQTNKFLIRWKGISSSFLKTNTLPSSLKSVSKKHQHTCNMKFLTSCVPQIIFPRLFKVSLETTSCRKVSKNFVRPMIKKSSCWKLSSEVLRKLTSTKFSKSGVMNFWKDTLKIWKTIKTNNLNLKINCMNKWIRSMPKISNSSTSNSNTCPTVQDLITETTAKVLVEAVVVDSVDMANNLRRVHMKTNNTWINNTKRRKTV